ncbi:MAG: GNAT family N-acetyltransferase [Rhodobacterales bacterium 12-65-15]|nr:MAG: GNAT family N-acetyltransferase [Rhodobacterales bacterium 12-65-15]
MSDPRPGTPVPDWTPPPRPGHQPMTGRHVRLEPLEAEVHAFDLHAAYEGHDALWDYMPYGPFASASEYHLWAREREAGEDPRFYVLRDTSGRCGGIASYLRITPEAGSIEVGHICIAPTLQRGVAVTEAMFLMLDWAFKAGYRRYEWKCNALNLPSRRAAQRLGFSFEGVFRNHMVVKGCNRDTAWFSVIDSDWPALREAFGVWLDPANFDAEGQQHQRLSDLTRPILQAIDPALTVRR